MHDRLIELLNKKYDHFCDQCGVNKDSHYVESLADYLLANGVIVPPCKVGQTIYRNIIDKPLGFNVMKIEVFEDEILFIDDVGKWFCVADIGTRVFLTKEEAEQALKGGAK